MIKALMNGDMMKKVKSFLPVISGYLLTLTILIAIILTIFLTSSYIILKKEIDESSEALLNLYMNDLENTLSKMDNYFTGIAMQEVELARLKSNDQNVRSLSAMILHNYMQELITDNEIADVIVVYDSRHDICLDVIKRGFDFRAKNLLRDHTKNLVTQNRSNPQWDILTIENESYLHKALIHDEQVIGVYLKAEQVLNYLDEVGRINRMIGLTDSEGTLVKAWGKIDKTIELGSSLSSLDPQSYFIEKKSILKSSLSLYSVVNKTSMITQINVSVIIVGIVVVATFVFQLFFLRYVKKEIAQPMQHIIQDMKIIKRGEYQNRIKGNFSTDEFLLLQQTTNKMIDEIVGLKIASYEKIIEIQDIELKSIRLQIKPHFFLNALVTISGLSIQNKNDLIVKYIEALSKNIRYMFRVGIHTVSIIDEIRHVNNYIEMQELKYPDRLFALIDLPKELEEWRVPQMIVHTFIENIYKYAISPNQIISFLVKVRTVEYQEEEMLFIEIEDDGKGYPQEIINVVKNNIQPINQDGTGFGLWSIKRMLEIMYEKNELMILGNKEPRGCYAQIYIPKEIKYEVRKEKSR